MNFDEVIKGTLKSNMSMLDISEERSDEIFEHIYEQAEIKNQSVSAKIIKVASGIINTLHMKDLAEVLIVAAIFIVIPIVAVGNKNIINSYQANSTKNEISTKNVTKNESSTKDLTKAELDNIKIKQNEIKDKDMISKEIAFNIEKPTIDMGDLKEVDATLKKETVNEKHPVYEQKFQYYTMEYKGNNGKHLIIIQSNAVTDGSLNLTNLTEKVRVKGVDAYIYEAKDSWTQLMFTKENKFYNLAAIKIPKSELLKIAESLQ